METNFGDCSWIIEELLQPTLWVIAITSKLVPLMISPRSLRKYLPEEKNIEKGTAIILVHSLDWRADTEFGRRLGVYDFHTPPTPPITLRSMRART